MKTVIKHCTEIELSYVDVRVGVPWGFVAGRWYGNRKVRPILALHGWLDNLGTWNKLLPLLPQHIGVLCLDLPGHGHSTQLPLGICYHAVDYLCVILRVMQEYNWSKVSILAHSMSSMLSFLFAAMYPQRLDMLISIDVVRTRYFEPVQNIVMLRNRIENFIVENERLEKIAQQEPPSYTYEQLEEVLYAGTDQSVELVNCRHILERNIRKSSKYPNKYYFSRDARIKHFFEFTTSAPFAAELARRIHNVPFCVIKGSASNYIDAKSAEVIAILRENNPHFEMHEVQGTHHVHLNNATAVSAIINPFINRHRPPLLEMWSLDDFKDDDTQKSTYLATEPSESQKSKL